MRSTQSEAALDRRALVNNKLGNKSVSLSCLCSRCQNGATATNKSLLELSFLPVRDGEGASSGPPEIRSLRLKLRGRNNKDQGRSKRATSRRAATKSTAGATGIDSHFVSFNFTNSLILGHPSIEPHLVSPRIC